MAKKTLPIDEQNIQRMAHCSGRCDHPERNCAERIGECAECSVYSTCRTLYTQGYRNAIDLLDIVKQEIDDAVLPDPDEVGRCITLDDVLLGGDVVLTVLGEHKKEIWDYRRIHEDE